MSDFAIQQPTAASLISFHLSGFKGYPNSEAGLNVFSRCIQECCISVEHASAVLKSFDMAFPTLREIITTANSCRAKFEPKESLMDQWRREYGPPQKFDIYPADIMALHWLAIRDGFYYTEGPGGNNDGYWNAAAARNQKEHPDSVEFVRAQIVRMGWTRIMALAASPERMPWTPAPWAPRSPGKAARPSRPVDTSMRAIAAPPITQADIDRAMERRKSTDQVDKELDEWSDPDR